MKINCPVDYVPGDYFFHREELLFLSRPRKKYSKFKLRITMEEEYNELIKWAEKQKEELHKS